MPVKKKPDTRYQILDELLSDRYHNYSWDDLTKEVNARLAKLDLEPVGRRTIEKDVEYLEYGPQYVEFERYSASYLDQNTLTTKKKRCLRYADPTFSIYKKEMTNDEKYLLSEALSILGQFDGLPDFAGLDKLKKSVNLNQDRKIVSFSKNPVENSTIFGELFSAIANKQVIELHYHTFSEPDKEKINIFHPYLLKEYNRRWYLFAAAFTDGKLLNFALDRIDECKPLPSYVFKEYDGDIDEWFGGIVGVTLKPENPVEHILLWVSDNAKGYIETKPIHVTHTFCRGAKEAELREKYSFLQGGSFYTIDCRENYELIRDLCSYGKDLLVLESDGKVKENVEKRIREMMMEYDKLSLINKDNKGK